RCEAAPDQIPSIYARAGLARALHWRKPGYVLVEPVHLRKELVATASRLRNASGHPSSARVGRDGKTANGMGDGSRCRVAGAPRTTAGRRGGGPGRARDESPARFRPKAVFG